jgi:tetratricopeptide (TPR) repeat protein
MKLKIPSMIRNSCLRAGLCTVAVSLVLSSSASAVDFVTKKSDGKKVNGTITGMSKNDLTLKRPQGGEEIVVPLSDIELIEWEGSGGELNAGYNDERKARYEQAQQRFLKAKSDAKSPSSFLQGEFEYILARVAAKQALIDPDKRDQAIQKLIAAEKAYPDHIRFYESLLLLVPLQLQAGDFENAGKAIDLLKKAKSSELNFRGAIAEGRLLAAEGKIDESVAVFAAAASSAGDHPAELALKTEALVGQARGLIAKTQFDEALKVLELITEKNGPAGDTASEAEAYLLQGQALRGLGRNKEAILAYLYVDVIYSREADLHAEALYQLVNLWKLDSQTDRSAEAAAKLVQLYPKSEWRKKLAGTE